jgi:SAM-dependent methyltransferase
LIHCKEEYGVTADDQAIADVQALYEAFASTSARLSILDAGCGRRSYLDFGEHVHLTGIDISEEQLSRNPRLNERIVGDLQEYPLPAAAFDVVVCWDVLEHLRDPRAAIRRMGAAVKPDGLLIIAGPIPRSLKGALAKLSPDRVHVWIFRLLNPQADEDEAPFHTYLRRDVMPARVIRHAREQGFAVLYYAACESRMQVRVRERLRVTGTRWRIVKLLIRITTAGRIDPERTDYVCVLRRNAAALPTAGVGSRRVV